METMREYGNGEARMEEELLHIVIQLVDVWSTMSAVSESEEIPSIREAPTMNMEINRMCLIQWAREYILSEQEDLWEFLKDRIK